jgi:hypothetical protein
MRYNQLKLGRSFEVEEALLEITETDCVPIRVEYLKYEADKVIEYRLEVYGENAKSKDRH